MYTPRHKMARAAQPYVDTNSRTDLEGRGESTKFGLHGITKHSQGPGLILGAGRAACKVSRCVCTGLHGAPAMPFDALSMMWAVQRGSRNIHRQHSQATFADNMVQGFWLFAALAACMGIPDGVVLTKP